MSAQAAALLDNPRNVSSQPWDRLPTERSKAFEAFTAYLRMGEKRTLRGVAEQLKKCEALMFRWSGVHKWVERSRAFDSWQAQAAYDEMRAGRAKAFKRHSDIGRLFQSKALEIMQGINPGLALPGGQGAGQAGQISPLVAARFAEVGHKLERLALGGDEQQLPPQIIVNINPRAPRTKEEAALES